LAFYWQLLAFTFFSKNASAQYYFYNDDYYDQDVLVEVGASIGAMNCLTDLGGKAGIGKGFIKDLNSGKSYLSGGIFANISYKSSLGLRLESTM
jgi:high-affinity Fe2+/Pb2+ permease